MTEAAAHCQSECGPARHPSSGKPHLASANTGARRSPTSSPSCSTVRHLVEAHWRLSAGASIHQSPRCQGSSRSATGAGVHPTTFLHCVPHSSKPMPSIQCRPSSTPSHQTYLLAGMFSLSWSVLNVAWAPQNRILMSPIVAPFSTSQDLPASSSRRRWGPLRHYYQLKTANLTM
jgi:hypothetical protein